MEPNPARSQPSSSTSRSGEIINLVVAVNIPIKTLDGPIKSYFTIGNSNPRIVVIVNRGRVLLTNIRALTDTHNDIVRQAVVDCARHFKHEGMPSYNIINYTFGIRGPPLYLEAMVYYDPQNMTYEPEVHPGLFYECFITPKAEGREPFKAQITFLPSGTIIINRVKSIDEYRDASLILRSMIHENPGWNLTAVMAPQTQAQAPHAHPQPPMPVQYSSSKSL